MSSRFSDLGLPAAVVSSLAARGLVEAFPIQTMAIPPALAGRDVCGKAPTGSGKTLAFGIPLAERVTASRPGRPSALILAPTRELAAQIQDELRPLLAPYKRSVASFYGGVGFGAQLNALRRGVDVAVACPGRLADLVQRGDIRLDEVQIVVIDEADRMADMGFLPEVKRLLDQVRPDRQTMLFSATLDGDVDVLIKRYQKNPERCVVESDERDGERTSHHYMKIRKEHRVGKAADLVSKHGPTVVFCRTKHGADRVATQMQKAGIAAVAIHGGRSQGQRDRALEAFTMGKAEALVATDVAARGIHVDDVACVLHFDVPQDEKDYIHRSGRTGRAGAEGLVVSFVTESEVSKFRKMQRSLPMTLIDAAPASPDAPLVRSEQSLAKAVTVSKARSTDDGARAGGGGAQGGRSRKPGGSGVQRTSGQQRGAGDQRGAGQTRSAGQSRGTGQPRSGGPAGGGQANAGRRSGSPAGGQRRRSSAGR